ncbi:hypothetical protein LCGC14_2297940, partial [marine sediment metagenome]
MKLTKKTTDEELTELRRNKMTTLDHFLQTGESEITWEGDPLVCDKANSILLIKGGVVYIVACWFRQNEKYERVIPKSKKKKSQWYSDFELDSCNELNMEKCAGALVPSPVSGAKFTIVMNGDEDGINVVSLENLQLTTTLSYECLAELLSAPGGVEVKSAEVVDRIASSKLKVIDSTADKTRPVTAAMKQRISALKKELSWDMIQTKIKPPEAGMTLIGYSLNAGWHRPATVLVSDGKQTYLIGQDEDTYFGCQLADNPQTISGAYVSLIPPRVRGK